MIEAICAHLHNWFVGPEDILRGTFSIEDGTLALANLQPGQYFRLSGSVFNDGVYAYPPANLTDETFTGEIWPLRLPRGLLTIAEEIEAWQNRYGEQAESPYRSERFGEYSYDRGEGAADWRLSFARRLDPYRRLRE